MNEAYVTLAVWCVGAALVGVFVVQHLRRKSPSPTERVSMWAKSNGLTVVELEHRHLLKGPFWWYRSPAVYRAVVIDTHGKRREAWIRLVYATFGKDTEEIRWERPA